VLLGVLLHNFLHCSYGLFQGVQHSDDDTVFPGMKFFLEEETSDLQQSAARAVQYSCIVLLCQLVGNGFFQRYLDLSKEINSRVDAHDKLQATMVKKKKCKWNDVVSHYLGIFIYLFGASPVNPYGQDDYFQSKMGSHVYSLYLMFLGNRTAPIPGDMEAAMPPDVPVPDEYRRKVSPFLKCTGTVACCFILILTISVLSTGICELIFLVVCTMWKKR
jgi:hypothetical protein